MDLGRSPRFSIYIHVPFCLRHCPYCDFTVAVLREIPHDAYARAVIAELAFQRPWFEGRRLGTVYFGGGTPGLLAPEAIADILGAVVSAYGHPEELTLEMNPECATPARLDALRSLGVDRLSFGVQSFRDSVLATLGRHHSGEGARAAIERARGAGFARISVDLIHGVPGQVEADVDHDLAVLADLDGVEHVSAYELTWEPRTAFVARQRRGTIRALPESDVHRLGERVRAGLEALGHARYEVSNFARPGAESRHNAAYWRGDEVLAAGVGAHGLRIDGPHALRRAGQRSLRVYLEEAARGAVAPPAMFERLDRVAHLGEIVMTGLRTREGISGRVLGERFGDWDAGIGALFARWAALGHGRTEGRGFRPSERAIDCADTLAVEALAFLEEEA